MHKSIVLVTLVVWLALLQVSTQQSLPQSVINKMASRESRHHHFLWHNLRSLWNGLDAETQSQIRKLGWAPPRPSVTANKTTISNNNAGEDFLYMHRQMIATVNKILSDNHEPYGRVRGWTSIPRPGDHDWPVPSNYTIPGQNSTESTIRRWKSDQFFYSSMKPLEDDLKNYTKLRNMTLGQLGTRIEFGIHSYMHLRFSRSESYGYRNKTTAVIPQIDEKWDNPRYDWLVDVYSSAVNPTFWKLHGWIDDRIGVWMAANNLKTITWKGTWTGGPMGNLPKLIAVGRTLGSKPTVGYLDETMAEVFRLLAKTGKEYKFEEKVTFDFSVSKSYHYSRKFPH